LDQWEEELKQLGEDPEQSLLDIGTYHKETRPRYIKLTDAQTAINALIDGIDLFLKGDVALALPQEENLGLRGVNATLFLDVSPFSPLSKIVNSEAFLGQLPPELPLQFPQDQVLVNLGGVAASGGGDVPRPPSHEDSPTSSLSSVSSTSLCPL
jgi:hypothetical protein